MMTGCGPSRSGWLMKVVTWPSLVGISICRSIMAVLLVSGCLSARSRNTIARKPGHDKASCLEDHTGLELRGPDRHCLVPTTPSQPTGDLAMTQTSNRFFDEIGRLMND